MFKKIMLLSILALRISLIHSSENEVTKRKFIAGAAQGTLSAPFAPWVIGCCIGDALFNLNQYAKGKKFDPLKFKNYAQEVGFATSFIPLSYLTYRKIFRLIRR